MKILRFISVILFVIINMIILVYSPNNSVDPLFTLNMLSLCQLICGILFLIMNCSYANFAILFVLLSFLFHQSHLFLTAFSVDVPQLFNTYQLFSPDITSQASLFVLQANIFLYTGIWLGCSLLRRFRLSFSIISPSLITTQKLNQLGGKLFLLGLPFNIYMLLKVVMLAKTGGYLASFEHNINGFVLTFASFMPMGFCLWLSGCENKKKASLATLYFVFYQLLIMQSGHRYDAIVALLIVGLIYYERYLTSLKGLYIVLGGFFSYIGLGVLNIISNMRSQGLISLDILARTFSFKENYLFVTMGEFGAAIYNVAQAVTYLPAEFNLSQFSKIFLTFTHLIPGLSKFIPNIDSILYYVNNFPNHSAMGGSYIGEIYFWAGEYGYLLSIVVGILVGYACKLNNNKNNALYQIPLYFFLLPLIRGYWFAGIRLFVWYYIVIWIMHHVVLKKKIS